MQEYYGKWEIKKCNSDVYLKKLTKKDKQSWDTLLIEDECSTFYIISKKQNTRKRHSWLKTLRF